MLSLMMFCQQTEPYLIMFFGLMFIDFILLCTATCFIFPTESLRIIQSNF